ncbi:HTH-type transcriptional regulator [Quillaja saponaria]|uniref:HTH-type transcriptional regulator n=1 Tax=Quillaja saponaria TaxID=32244 RepID=A0AAD7PF98_QUISA|nr:HTH-type transcriptional regulator [Quillaja saponaria]
MGACASSHIATKSIPILSKANSKRGIIKGGEESFRRPSTIMVIHSDGRKQEFKQPIQAKFITSQTEPDSFLCNSESMILGMCIPRVPDEEELRPGQIYFLLPLSQAREPLSLPHLCELAVKATAALVR